MRNLVRSFWCAALLSLVASAVLPVPAGASSAFDIGCRYIQAVFGSKNPLAGGREAVRLTAPHSPARLYALHWSRYREALRQNGYDSPAAFECRDGRVQTGSAPPELVGYGGFRVDNEARLVSFELEFWKIDHRIVLGPNASSGPLGLRGRVFSADDSPVDGVLFVVVNLTNTSGEERLVRLSGTLYRGTSGTLVGLKDASSPDPISIGAGQSVTLGLGFERRGLGGEVLLGVEGSGASKRFALNVPRPEGAPRRPPLLELRAVARKYAEDWLHGSIDDLMKTFDDRECADRSHGHATDDELATYLRRLRTTEEQVLGRPLSEIRVTVVRTREVSETRGEAEVQYNLPDRLAGNDNWVQYKVSDGIWLVADCKLPIGGQSESVTCVYAADPRATSTTTETCR